MSTQSAGPKQVDAHLAAMDAGARWCYYVPENGKHDGQFVPSLVVENVAGHRPMMGNGEGAQPWYWGKTLTEARRVCESANRKRGITPDVAEQIVLSSYAAAYRDPTICRQCCGTVEPHRLSKSDVCFSCDFWQRYVENRDAADRVRINGSHYIIGEEDARGERGCGGSKFIIEFTNGRRVITRNLWVQGKIPAHFREQLPDNAQFIREGDASWVD